MPLRVATYNVENLFGRAKVLNFANHSTGDEKLEKIGELQAILKKDSYSFADRRRAGDLYNDLKSYIGYNILRSEGSEYYLFGKFDADNDGEKETYILNFESRDEWEGFITFDRDRFSDLQTRMTARVITEVNADVLCIIEAESRLVLDNFNSDRLERMYPYNMLIDCINDPRGIDVGVYSKHPIGGVRSNIFAKTSDNKNLFSRDCLEVEVLVGDTPVYLLANHFKSKSGGGDAKRKLQAEAVRDILAARYDLSTQRVIVLGDLNDDPDSDPLAPLLAMDGLEDVLATDKGPAVDLRWTYRYKDELNQIDYILVSEALKGELTAAGVERRGMPPEKLEGTNAGVVAFPEIENWRTAGSDHAAVWADFDIPG